MKKTIEKILDRFYTPPYKIFLEKENIIIQTEYTRSCCIPFKVKDDIIWYLETMIYNTKTGDSKRCLIQGYYDCDIDIARQVLLNIIQVEVEIYSKKENV